MPSPNIDVNETYRLALTLLQQGRHSQAEACLEQILQAEPTHADALQTRALLCRASGDPASAARLLERAIALQAAKAVLHANLGLALHALQQPQAALDALSRAVTLDPASADILVARANLFRELARPAEALDDYATAQRLQPDRADAWAGHGDVLLQSGRLEAALASYDRALALQPDFAAVWYNRSNLLRRLDRHDEALESVSRSLALQPDCFDALNNRGNLLRHFNRHAEALVDYDRALALQPGSASAHTNRGNVLRELNRLDAAREAYQQAIDAAPQEVMHYRNLASVMRLTREDPCYAALTRFAAHEERLGAQDRVYLHFALGDALDTFGDAEGAFRHFQQGNALQRALLRYDEPRTLARFEQLREEYAPGRLDATQEATQEAIGRGHASDLPVFVVGMPRCGSTLVEQALSNHPDVYGAGECGFFSNVLDAQRGRNGPAEDFNALGAEYLRLIRQLGGLDARYRRVVDKTLPNFLNLGAIHLALPNARFIHVRRDPVESCLSTYSKLLVAMPYSFDLGELGRYYAAYERLMEHWREVLPAGVLLEVRYEDLVADLERELQRIFAHCGLDWHPASLDFHRNDRAVATASALQVRQPIYTSSLKRWHPDATVLGPLLEGLGRADPASGSSPHP